MKTIIKAVSLAIGRRLARRLAALALALTAMAAAPTAAQAACVAAALNARGEQIAGTRAVTRGIFPKVVCNRALNRCERRLNRIRAETRRRRPYARCEVIASGLRADSEFGPALEGTYADRYDDRYDRYDDRYEGRYSDRYDDRYDRRGRDDRGYDDRCNYAACSRYKTFRASDCSYKPNVYERRRCTL